MRNVKWLRMGLGSCVVAGASVAMFLAACGDDDNGTVTGVDSGLPDVTTNPPTDSGGPGDGGEGGAGDAGQVAKIQLVNAAEDLGPNDVSGGLRVCYALGAAGQPATATQAPLPPLPDTAAPGTPFPGVFIGTGGSIPGTGADLSLVDLQPYVMNAQSLAQRGVTRLADGGVGIACADLFDTGHGGSGKDAGGAMTENVDYWKLPTIPAGSFKRDHSYLLVLTGCANDSTIGAGLEQAHCGPGAPDGSAPGVGNLKVTAFDLDNATVVDGTKLGAQFVHASTGGDAVLGSGVGHPAVIPSAGGTAVPLGSAVVALGTVTPMTQVSGVADPDAGAFTSNPEVASLAFGFQTIRALTYGQPPPAGTDFANGKAYTFIALGDPAVPAIDAGGFNLRSYHYLAFPNDPVVPAFQ